MMEKECNAIILECLSGSISEYWEIDKMISDITRIIPLPDQMMDKEYIESITPEKYSENVSNRINSIYVDFQETLGDENAKMVEQYMMLKAMDTNWVQHLTTMDNLRQGIGLQAVGQRDPLVMYKKEGHDLFQGLQSKIEDDLIHTIFRAEGMENNVPKPSTRRNQRSARNTSTTNNIESTQPKRSISTQQKVGRNVPCPCGSGKKYKRCCGAAA